MTVSNINFDTDYDLCMLERSTAVISSHFTTCVAFILFNLKKNTISTFINMLNYSFKFSRIFNYNQVINSITAYEYLICPDLLNKILYSV